MLKKNVELELQIDELGIDREKQRMTDFGYGEDEETKNEKHVKFQEHESKLVDVKQQIKETEELIEKSNKNLFQQTEVLVPPLKGRVKNPFKKDETLDSGDDPVESRKDIVQKMEMLLSEKEREIRTLTVQRHRYAEEIRVFESQTSSFKQEIMNLNDQLEQMYQTRLDKDELNRTKEDNQYLE